MEKIIHYCWFGGKPLPKLAKKCIKSWKKYFPDWKIIEWNENNFDVNMTNFSKQAYDSKKWAFVSDVARIYALKKYGGIYFDTDMIVKKDSINLLDCEVMAGWESEYNVAVGVLYVKEKNNKLINQLWDFYTENEFSVENVYSLSIPAILTNILKSEYGLQSNHMENQDLKDGIRIYARDYFYPISSDMSSSNLFTERTYMVHYYVGSWISDSQKKRIKFQMFFGKKTGDFILDILIMIKHFLKKVAKIILYPYLKYRRNKQKQLTLQTLKKDFYDGISNLKNNDYVVFYNKNWLGTKNATQELFVNTIGIDETTNQEFIKYIVDIIEEKKIKLIVFSAFAKGWTDIIKELKKTNPSLQIKVIWHGSPAMNVEAYDRQMFEEIFGLLENKEINSIAFVKKSLYEFFKLKGYNVEFLYNRVELDDKFLQELPNKRDDNFIRVGLYASGDRWVKNFYNQLGAASLFENVKIDCIPLNEKSLKLAKIFKTSLNGLTSPLDRMKLIERMAKNDINFYVTFSECSPLIPLESLEVGVPCITSHNHHYFDGTELVKYLVVDENDNMMAIYKKAKECLDNKEVILNLYQKWKIDNNIKSKKSVELFLNKSKGDVK